MSRRFALLVGTLLASVPAGAQVAVPGAPEDGGPRNFVVQVDGALNLRDGTSTSAVVITRLRNGTLLDNLGCRAAEGRAWCDVQPLGGGARGFVAAEYLRPAVSPNGAVMTGPDDSAQRASEKRFDATGSVPCATTRGQPTTACAFGVARAGGGYATVVVTRPDGRMRAIYFRMGVAIGGDVSQADYAGPFRATKEADLYLIRIGDERYEVPDAVVLGG